MVFCGQRRSRLTPNHLRLITQPKTTATSETREHLPILQNKREDSTAGVATSQADKIPPTDFSRQFFGNKIQQTNETSSRKLCFLSK